MARRRKTPAELRQEWLDQEKRSWDEYEPKLAAVNSLDDAWALHREAPGRDWPGHKYYSNLGFFLMNFNPPNDASRSELLHYLTLVRLLDAVGELKPDALPRIEAELLRAIESRNPWETQ
jgi:hypothetical protein